MKQSDYPALFQNADASAAKRQTLYFRFLLLQYSLLVIASAATLLTVTRFGRVEAGIYFVAVGLAAAILLVSVLQAPEKDWYTARALAESIKTLTWRYMMAAEPFGKNSAGSFAAEKAFTDYLPRLLEMNDASGKVLSHAIVSGAQITPEMERIRSLPFNERREVYLQQRIQNQLDWYRSKAQTNRRMSRFLTWICVAVYAIAIVIAGTQFYHTMLFDTPFPLNWVTEPILVVAASLLGWIQAKRYSELAASYTLAVHEISKIRENITRVTSQKEFAEFVLESETAFSREHTQWVARQSSNAF